MTEKGKKPPTSQERKACWEARDAYFECLTKHDLWLQGVKPQNYQQVLEIDPLHLEAASDTRRNKELYLCRQFKNSFDKHCLGSWVWVLFVFL
jgi:hypothetical protein